MEIFLRKLRTSQSFLDETPYIYSQCKRNLERCKMKRITLAKKFEHVRLPKDVTRQNSTLNCVRHDRSQRKAGIQNQRNEQSKVRSLTRQRGAQNKAGTKRWPDANGNVCPILARDSQLRMAWPIKNQCTPSKFICQKLVKYFWPQAAMHYLQVIRKKSIHAGNISQSQTKHFCHKK